MTGDRRSVKGSKRPYKVMEQTRDRYPDLGKVCELKVLRFTDFGAYLGRPDEDRSVLLPRKEADGLKTGDMVRAFIYLDSEDRPIATLREPVIQLGQMAPLKVKEVTGIGAFLDWGLEKDLLLPFHEMVGRPEKGDEILVRLYLDKSGRLAASMKKLYSLMRTDSPYKEGDDVSGRIYEFGHDRSFGTFIAVDDLYAGMVPPTEDMRGCRAGDLLRFRVTGVKPDGKLDLTVRKAKEKQIPEDSEKILGIIASYAGVLPFTEKADPEVIMRETGLSKAAFKRAIGHLYRERLITLDGGVIRAAQDIKKEPGDH